MPLRLLALACVAAWWAQALPTLTEPPTGAHAWRETDGLIVARNYCLEGAPFSEPRVDNRDRTDGRTGTEFPVLEWVSGRVGCATGDYVTVWRVTSFAFAGVLALSVWALARRRWEDRAGSLALLVLATSPLIPYFSRTAQPDMTAAGLAALAMLLAARGLAPVAFAAAALAALVKLPAAVYLLPTLWLSWDASPAKTRARAAVVLAMGLGAAVVALAWYRYARGLEQATGITNFGVSRSLSQLVSEWLMPAFWVKSFVQWPFDVWVFPLATVALLGVLAWRRRATDSLTKVLGVTVLAYVMLCGYSGAHHDYYGVLLLPALSLMAAWAANELYARFPSRAFVVLAVLACAALGWQWSRARRWWPSHQAEWAALTTWSKASLGPHGVRHGLVFSDGNPRLFWFTGQIGRWGDLQSPSLGEGDDFAAVDRLRLDERAKPLEAALLGHGCTEAFANEVAFICLRSP